MVEFAFSKHKIGEEYEDGTPEQGRASFKPNTRNAPKPGIIELERTLGGETAPDNPLSGDPHGLSDCHLCFLEHGTRAYNNCPIHPCQHDRLPNSATRYVPTARRAIDTILWIDLHNLKEAALLK